MKKTADTITAIATPSGRGGVGIVRISGPQSKEIALKIIQKTQKQSALTPTTTLNNVIQEQPVSDLTTRSNNTTRKRSASDCEPLPPRTAHFTAFYDTDNTVIDEGIVLFFENPHSFTGEDVIELQSHGSPIVLDRLVKCTIHHGARMARPGEFSERAFLNKKIDLVQAEAIADLIAANSEQAARSAVRSLQGEFSKKIQALQNSLTHLRMQIEAMIDFPEEEIDFLADPHVLQLLQTVIDDVLHVKNQATRGALLQSGLQVVIVGKPNAGKSSLLNYLSGRESAIVTPIPGTTRDILRESINLDGLPLHIIDTAGLRETDDIVEQEGVRRAYAQMAQADVVLWLVDAAEGQTSKEALFKANGSASASDREIIIRNKIDLTNEPPSIKNNIISLSITQNLGLGLLIQHLKKIAGFQSEETNGFIARRRHVDAIDRAYQFLLHGQTQLQTHRAGELLAEDLRQAQIALSDITGEFSADDLLGEIFSSFCIGK